MSNPYLDSAKELERLSKMFAGLVALGPELQRVGSLQQAADEGKVRLDQTNAAIAQAEADLAQATEKAKQAQDSHAQILVDHKAQADAAAAEIIAEAKRQADSIIAAAEQQGTKNAAAITQGAEQKMAALNERIAAAEYLAAKIAADKDQCATLDAQIAAKTQELQSVTEAHKKFLASIGAGKPDARIA